MWEDVGDLSTNKFPHTAAFRFKGSNILYEED